MKVIKEPDFKDWQQIVNCLFCTAQLEIEPSDIYYLKPGDDETERCSYKICCAICNEPNVLDNTSLPMGLKTLIRKSYFKNSNKGLVENEK